MRYLFFFFLMPYYAYSQSDLTIHNSAFVALKNNDFTFEVSIGEMLINTIANKEVIINQGFLQSDYYYSSGLPTNEYADLKVYPNPFTKLISIEANISKLKFKIYNSIGELVYENSDITELNLEFLNSGVFLLTILDENEGLLNTFKLTKLQ